MGIVPNTVKNTPLVYTSPPCFIVVFHLTHCRWPKTMASENPCLQGYRHVLRTACRIQCSSLMYSTVCIQRSACGPTGSSTMAACIPHPTWFSRGSVHYFHIAFSALSTNKMIVGKLKVISLFNALYCLSVLSCVACWAVSIVLMNTAVVGATEWMSEWSVDQCIAVSMNTGTLWLACAVAGH